MSESSKRTRPGVDQQRLAILQAAVAVFSEVGTCAASVSQIAGRAGVSRDTFYRCYGNKGAVVDALYQRSVSDSMLAITGDPQADFGDPAWLAGAIDRMVDEIVADHQTARFLFLESADPGSRASQAIDEAFDDVARTMRRWCRQHHGHAPGRETVRGLLAAAQWLVHRAIADGRDTRRIRQAKRAIGELFGAFFAGVAAGR